MKVTLLAVGSRGDVQPYVALGRGLQAAGFDVTLATHGDFADFVTAHGLQFHNLGGNMQAIMQSETGVKIASSGSNPFPLVLRLRRALNEIGDEFLQNSLDASKGADAIIYAVFAFTGFQIGEKMGIPAFPALLQPLSRTSYFPLQPPLFGKGSRFYNRVTYIGAQQLFGQVFGSTINNWRKKDLGLPPLPRKGMYSLIDKSHVPILYGYSPTFVPQPRDWGDWLHVCGYWFLDQQSDWQAPPQLVDFIQAGKPPVYVGFGSMPSRDPAALAAMVITALRRAGQRGLLLSGWGGLRPGDVGDDIFVVDNVPHAWLFPQMAAIVHHGGAGTTGAGVRSGKPSLALPFFGDQYFWADRLSRVGVGPKYIPHDKLNVTNLTAAIRQATSDPTIIRRAAALGQRIRAEDGVGNAVAALKQELEKRR